MIRSGKRRRAVILGAAGLLVLSAACGGRGKEGAPPVPRPRVAGVELVAVTPENRDRVVEAVGTVRARTIASVASQVLGRIAAVYVAEGARVGKGAPLAVLDDAAFRAQVTVAEGAAAEARAARIEADRAIGQAKAAKDLAETTYARFRNLRDASVVTAQEFDEVEAKRAVAGEEYERALAKRTQAEARIRQAEGAENGAKTMLSYTRLAAPFAGIVTEKRAEGGAMAVPGIPLFVLEETSRYRLEAAVPESLLSRLRVGSRVAVALDAAPGSPVSATVSEIVPAVDPASRTFTVKADVAAPGLRTGMSGRLRIPAGTASVLAVPRKAVVGADGTEGVFAVGPDNVARRRMVRTGEVFGDRVEILSGLSAGDRVAVAPLERLTDGGPVEVRK